MIWAFLLRQLELDRQPIVDIVRQLRDVDREESLNVLIHKSRIWEVA